VSTLVQRDRTIENESKVISRLVRAQADPTSKQFLIMAIVSIMKEKQKGSFGVETHKKLRTWSVTLLRLKDIKFFRSLIKYVYSSYIGVVKLPFH